MTHARPIPADDLTRETWIAAHAALALDELVEKGLLDGPLIVKDKPALKALLVHGRNKGFPEPTGEELRAAVIAIENKL
jgi:hypothetical protein